jgi:hypothetical protein
MTTIEEGHFQLYSSITPALKANDYVFEVSQELHADSQTGQLGPEDLPVDALHTHVRVTAPRFQLSPDQVLSTFPPAGTSGAYGSRLPQIVIKRRTLPWERQLRVPDDHGGEKDLPETTPWLALVLVAEGEAELVLNADAADCVTPGVTLDGEVDVAKGNYLEVTRSMLEKVLPTQLDVPLLAHARQVDIHDTELMMGDDDGFLAVVISNRLPVAGTDDAGKEVPVKYLACLVNLEGQFHQLLPKSPPAVDFTTLFGVLKDAYVQPAVFDHIASGELSDHWADPHVNPVVVGADGAITDIGAAAVSLAGPMAGPAPQAEVHKAMVASIKPAGAGVAPYSAVKGHTTSDVYEAMAAGFTKETGAAGLGWGAVARLLERRYRFPVLLHWSFVSTGERTFEYLMTHLDSGLLGTTPKRPYDETGREPLEVVETGHVGLVNRTRVGDEARVWYRGPLLPHPSSGERLPLAHASDQLRAVVGDGREDVSLAAAFEIGRLLALSKPSMVAALLRWRQQQFRAARSRSLWGAVAWPWGNLDLAADVRGLVERELRGLIATDPDGLLGPPRELVTPGDPVDWGQDAMTTLTTGLDLGVDLGAGLTAVEDLSRVAAQLRSVPPTVVPTYQGVGTDVVGATLAGALDGRIEHTMSEVLANELAVDPSLGPNVVRTPEIGEQLIVEDGLLDIDGAVILDGSAADHVIGLDRSVLGGLDTSVVAHLGAVVPHADAPEARAERPRRRRRRRPPVPDPVDELLEEDRS